MPKVFVYFRNFKKLTNFFLSLVVFRKNWRVQSGGFPLIQLFWVNSDSPHQKTVRWVDSSTQAHGSWTSLLQDLFGLLPGSKEFSLGLLVFDSFPWSVLKEYSASYSLLYWRRPRSVTFLFGCMQADSSSTCLQFSVPFPYVFSSSSFFFWASLTFVLLQQLSVGSGSRAQRCLVLWIWGC